MSADHVPLLQLEQVVPPTCPLYGWYLPAGHCAHDVPDELPVMLALPNVPGEHAVHTAIDSPADLVDHVPLTHAMHAAADTCPVMF